MKKALSLAIAAALASAAATTQAYEAGDWIAKAGAIMVAPDVDSDEVPGLGVEVDADNNVQLSLIGTYMATDHFGLELLAATPFSHTIDVKGTSLDAGSFKHLPPTFTVQWYPRGGQSGWQPYVGIGLNYTFMYDEKVDSDLEGLLGPAKLSLDDSFGLSASAGLDLPLGEHWALTAGVWYIDIDTKAEVKYGEGQTARFDVSVDPWVYNLGIAYKF